MRQMNFKLIKQLWMFLAVAEELHFGRAAKRLGMSQPPLTEQIKLLEHSLNLTLFERSRRGTKLSPAGSAILPAARKFAEQVQNFEQTVQEVVTGQLGVLHIGAITSAMLESVPPLVEKLKKQHPKLSIRVDEIDSVEAVPLLESGNIDIAFARLDGEIGSHITTQPLSKDKLAVALPNDHRLLAQNSISLSELGQEQLVMSARQVSPVYFDMLTSKCREHGLSMHIAHEVRSITAQIAYVSCAQGVALVPYSARKLAPSNVVVRPLQEDNAFVTVSAAWNSLQFNPLKELVIAQLEAV